MESNYEFVHNRYADLAPRVKPTEDELDAMALSALADEMYDSVKMYCRLGAKSQKIVASLVASAYRMDQQDGELNLGEPFKITIVPNEKT